MVSRPSPNTVIHPVDRGENTVIEYSTNIQAKGLIRIFMPLAKYGIKITFSSEMSKYNNQLLKDLKQNNRNS